MKKWKEKRILKYGEMKIMKIEKNLKVYGKGIMKIENNEKLKIHANQRLG